MFNENQMNLKERVIALTKQTGVLPCIKTLKKEDYLAYAQAMYDGGARIIEITMTTPGVLEGIEAVSAEFKGRLYVAAGTVLDAPTAREVILHGGSLIVSPTVREEVIRTANRYGVPVYSGAFTATECQLAMELGASMVKIFPAALGGPKYMTNLKMILPEINLIPSGGINEQNAGEFIHCGACALSGARTFMNFDMIREHGLSWISGQVAKYIELVRKAKEENPFQPV